VAYPFIITLRTFSSAPRQNKQTRASHQKKTPPPGQKIVADMNIEGLGSLGAFSFFSRGVVCDVVVVDVFVVDVFVVDVCCCWLQNCRS
jgi:hypothetical protein